MNTARIGSFALLLAMAMLYLVGCSSPGPADTVKSFHKHVANGEVEKASEMMSGEIVEMIGEEKLQAGLAEQTKTIREMGGIESFDILSEEVNGQVATVTYKVTYGNGDIEEDEADLMKIDGKWRFSMGDK